MKVIVAGMPKTGTKTMNAALTRLGYNVYDIVENLWVLCDDYTKITFDGWTTEDFKRMYENVDAVVDFPAFYYWDEIHRAFPDAKIILTVRDNEERWVRSLEAQHRAVNGNLMIRLWQFLSPTCKRGMKILKRLGMISYGTDRRTIRGVKINATLSKKLYRVHNDYVQHTAPKDKLLVFNCKKGWGPLCEFLDVPVPNEPFPHKNAGASIFNELDKYPILMKMKREAIINLALIVAAAVALTAMLFQYFWYI